MESRLKCVFIDWHKTLSYSPFWGHLEGPTRDKHGTHGRIEKWLFREHRQIIDSWMLGALSTEKVLGQLASDLSIDFETVMRELQESCQNMTLCSTEIPGLLNAVRARNIRVAIATDNMDTFRRFTAPALKLDSLCDDLLISSELRVMKDTPEPSGSIPFFDTYLQNHNLGYSDVVLLDDSPDKTGKYARLGFPRIAIASPDHLMQELGSIARS